MEYVCSCLIVVLCGLIGFSFAKEYEKKYEFYKSLCEFVKYLKIHMKYDHSPLKNHFKNFEGNKNFQLFLNVVYNQIEKGCINKYEIKQVATTLKDEELMEICTFLSQLGKMDIYAQENLLENNLNIFLQRCEDCLELKNKNSPTLKKLGIGVGLIISIILI